MMAALFFLMTVVIGGTFIGRPRWLIISIIILLLLTYLGCWAMLWYHATSNLKINW